MASEPRHVSLRVLPQTLAIVRLDADAAVPAWAGGAFLSCTRTPAELSIVCSDSDVPANVTAERNWCALEVVGPLDFGEIGILTAIALPLRDAGVSIFVVSTYDTDFVLVRKGQVEAATAALAAVGCHIG